MPATRITITTDQFFEGTAWDGHTPREISEAKYREAQIASRKAVAKTLRALADELDKGEYVGNFALPMLDASNWTESQCLEAMKNHPRYQGRETVDLEGLPELERLKFLRIRASYTGPDCLNGDVDEL